MKNLKNITAAFVALMLFSNIASAQTVKPSYASIADEPLKVKYVGEDGDYLVFSVSLQSVKPANAKFVIADEAEGELYSSTVGNNFKTRTVKIEKREADQVLNFKMVVDKKTYSKSFYANTNMVETTTVAESSVTRL